MLLAETDVSAWIGVIGVGIGWALKSCTEYLTQSRMFDQRLRLEKEYELYLDLWDKLFEFRRTIGTARSHGTHPEDMPSDDEIRRVFNDLQLAVLRGEPFYSDAIATSASRTTLPGRQLVQNLQDINHLNSQPKGDGERVNEMKKENTELFGKFETEFELIRAAIRKRVGPP